MVLGIEFREVDDAGIYKCLFGFLVIYIYKNTAKIKNDIFYIVHGAMLQFPHSKKINPF